MPKKPTSTIGYIAFGKDGSVRKHDATLPDTPKGQEADVGERLLRLAPGIFPSGSMSRVLEEDNNDIQVVADGKIFATIELTEINFHEFSQNLTQAEYGYGNYWVRMPVGDSWYALDPGKIAALVAARVQQKRDRNYAKPASGEFWLVVWSAHGVHIGSARTRGKWCVSRAIQVARDQLEKTGSGPFDRVFFFGLQTRPEALWPGPFPDGGVG